MRDLSKNTFLSGVFFTLFYTEGGYANLNETPLFQTVTHQEYFCAPSWAQQSSGAHDGRLMWTI